MQLIVGQWRDDDSRRNGVDGSPSLSPSGSLEHHPQHIATLGVLVSLQRIVNGFQERKFQQMLRGRHGQRIVLLLRQGRQPVSALRRDNHARATRSYHLPELLYQHAGAVEIHPQNFLHRSLRGRYPSGIHHIRHLTQAGGILHQFQNILPGAQVAPQGRALKPSVLQGQGCLHGIPLTIVGQDDVLSSRHPSDDGQPYASGTH